ncbi:MAG: GNAT family N-acetyltransferase [Lysobacteraceae bacterium]|nr:GNAT family N-acetyltransferase [Xanthomonadaceae bacterium]HRY00948.1 GNAT family N-acetyltransferase [Xanthomonadaceae bacterium]
MTTSLNRFCPRSGEPVSDDSLTRHRGRTVGFCNPGCRDDFDNGGPRAVEDRRYFDVLIRESTGLLPGGRAGKALEAVLPTLNSERLRLRAPRETDVEALFAVFSDPKVTRYWSHPPWTDRAQATELIDHICQHALNGQLFQWAIAEGSNDRLIGTVTLFFVNRSHRRCEVGFALRSDRWGEGLANEALSRAMRYGQAKLDLRRFEADVDPDNSASLGLLKRLGFEEEGRARARWRVGDGVQDSILLGRVVSD